MCDLLWRASGSERAHGDFGARPWRDKERGTRRDRRPRLLLSLAERDRGTRSNNAISAAIGGAAAVGSEAERRPAPRSDRHPAIADAAAAAEDAGDGGGDGGGDPHSEPSSAALSRKLSRNAPRDCKSTDPPGACEASP